MPALITTARFAQHKAARMHETLARVGSILERPGEYSRDSHAIMPLLERTIIRPRVTDELRNTPITVVCDQLRRRRFQLPLCHEGRIAIFPKPRQLSVGIIL